MRNHLDTSIPRHHYYTSRNLLKSYLVFIQNIEHVWPTLAQVHISISWQCNDVACAWMPVGGTFVVPMQLTHKMLTPPVDSITTFGKQREETWDQFFLHMQSATGEPISWTWKSVLPCDGPWPKTWRPRCVRKVSSPGSLIFTEILADLSCC